jgi:hypothetical protein
MTPNQDTEFWQFTDSNMNVPGITAEHFQFQPIPGWPVKKWQPMNPGGVLGKM